MTARVAAQGPRGEIRPKSTPVVNQVAAAGAEPIGAIHHVLELHFYFPSSSGSFVDCGDD